MNFSALLQQLLDRQSLSQTHMREVMTALMNGQLSAVQMSALLCALRAKGESAAEIAGAAEAMRSAAIPVRCSRRPLIDTCGTGGDGKGTFNVSTTSAFVVAGAGFTVAKHGNRSVSSRCGSADVLDALGVPMVTDAKRAEHCLEEVGLAFLFAPAFHPAMKHAMPIRKELGVRTIFNLLGPLSNPASPSVQLVGVFAEEWLKPVADVLKLLGCEEAVVVHSNGHDEIALSGETRVAEIRHGKLQMLTWKPDDFGVASRSKTDVSGGTPEACADILNSVLEGKSGPALDMVVMNAAAAIRAAMRSKAAGEAVISLKEAAARARESIQSGAALRKLTDLKSFLSKSAVSHG